MLSSRYWGCWREVIQDYRVLLLRSVFPCLTTTPSLLIRPLCRSTSSTPAPLPALHYLTRFVYSGAGDSALVNVDGFLSTQTVALHTLVIRHSQRYPASFLPVGNLRNLYLTLSISSVDFLSQILAHGRQLETLRLDVDLEYGCVLSTVFRAYAAPNSFPTLRKLSFVLTGAAHNFSDPDLFPAVAEFVRGYRMLDGLCISNTYNLAGFGYDAAVWGVLPSLINLRTLLLDVPKDLPPALSAWLIPRGVTVLDLQVARHATIDINVRDLFRHMSNSTLSPFVPLAIMAWSTKRTQVPCLAR
jgi:hypothetical protein